MDKIMPENISSTEDLYKQLDKLAEASSPSEQKWIFRGQKKDSELKTSLERLCEDLDIRQCKYGNEVEEILLREFKRRLHHYETHLPDPDDDLEWLAAMQHYGAPTRLLDWTHSPYVALYFALESKASKNGNPVVWAVDIRWVQKTVMRIIKKNSKYTREDNKTKKTIKSFIVENPTKEDKINASKWLYQLNSHDKFVFPATPFNLNKRLTVQKGFFLCPVDSTESFYSQIEAMPGFYDGHGKATRDKKNIMKFHVNLKERREILRHLQTMNVSADTLMPGLEGFARSLSVYHHRFKELK